MKLPTPFRFHRSPAASVFRAALCIHFVATTAAQAATYFWDGGTVNITANGNSASGGAAGTWNATIQNWDNGVVPHIAWPNLATDTAAFAGTAGTVSLGSGSVNVGTLTVATAGYTFSSGTINFPTASSGIIDVKTVNNTTFSASLAGKLTYNATGSSTTAGTTNGIGVISGNNSGLTYFELNANTAANQLWVSSAGALGPNGSAVKFTRGLVGLSGTGMTYNAWATDFAGGTLRLRAGGTSTYSGNGTLSANTEFGIVVAGNLVYSGTLNLNANTLTLAPNAATDIALNGAVSGSGNLTVNIGSLSGSTGLGTVTMNTANPAFTGTATTTAGKGTLVLNHVNALQAATLATGASAGTQAVTFTVAGDNTYNLGALSGADDLAIGANTLSVGAKAVDTTFSAILSGSGGKLTKVGVNKLTLAASPTYDGLTTVSAGTLALNNAIALAAGSSVSLAAGATLDVSASATYTWGASASLSASGTGATAGSTAAEIKAGAGIPGIDLGSRPVTLNFTPTTFTGDLTHPPLSIASGSLNINSAITLVNSGASPLGSGTYLLIKASSASPDSSSGTPTLNGTVGGQGLVAGKNAAVQRNASTGDIELTVQDALAPTIALTRHSSTTDNNTYGDALQFDVNVGGAGATPTGTVELRDGSQNGTLVGSGTLADGAVTLTPALNALTAGTHTLYAVYMGDPTYQFGSNTLSQTVKALFVSVSGATANSKMFDNTTAATTNGGIVSIVVAGDTAAEINANLATFANPGPGTAIGVTVALGGTKAASYSLASPPVITADILTTATWTTLATPQPWDTAANWLNALVGTGSGNTADFSTLDLPADTIVNLTAPRTVGSLVFGDTETSSTPAAWTLANNGSAANKLILAGGTPTVTVNTLGVDKSVTLSAVVDGSAGLTKAGVGTLALTGVNTYSGGTVINNGTLTFSSDAALGAVPATPTPGSLTLNGGTLSQAGVAVALSSNRGMSVGAGGGTLAIASPGSGSLTYNGLIAGTGSLTLNPAVANSSMLMSSQSTYSGGTLINGVPSGFVFCLTSTLGPAGSPTSGPFGTGTITFNGAGTRSTIGSDTTIGNPIIIAADTTFPNVSGGEKTLTLSGPLTLAGGDRVLTVTIGVSVSGKSLTLSGAVGDGGNNHGLTKAGNGNLVLSGANTYGGDTTINAGKLQLGAAGVIPDGNGKGNVAVNATLDLNAFSETINGLSGAGTVDSVAGGTPTLTVGGNDATSTFGGVIKNTAGSLALTKVGTGAQTLTGALSYGGATTVNAGTLTLAYASSSLNANPGNDASSVTIAAAGAILDLTFIGTDKVEKLFVGATQMPAGIYGKSGSLSPVIGIPQLTGDGTLSVASGPSFATWIISDFLNGSVASDQQGPTDDPDHDGISNLVEYAIAGQDPTVPGAAPGSFNGTTLSFTKRAGTSGLTYAIEESTDLGVTVPWTEVAAGPSYLNDATTISYTLTPGAPAKHFLRLKVASN